LFAEGFLDLGIEVGTGDVVGIGTGEGEEAFGGNLTGGGVVFGERFGAREVGVEDDERFAGRVPIVLCQGMMWEDKKEASEVAPQEGADARVNGAEGISHPKSK
jgi:hypothetical protein